MPPVAEPLVEPALTAPLLPPAPPAAPLPLAPPMLPVGATLFPLTVPVKLVVAVIVELLLELVFTKGLLELVFMVDAPLIAVPLSNALPAPMVCVAEEFSFACGLPLPDWLEVAVAVWALTGPGPLLVFVGFAMAPEALNVSAIAVDISVLFILISPLNLQNGPSTMLFPK